MKKIRIRIGQDGKTQIRVEVGRGKDCLSFTRAAEQALGTVEQRELLPGCRAAASACAPRRSRPSGRNRC